jgi:hypothetical protein
VGLGFELDPMVFELAGRNLALLGRPIELLHGGYETLLSERPPVPDAALVVFVAPPWGTALDEREGLDLKATVPPILEVIDRVLATFPDRRLLFVIQVYESVAPASLREVEGRLHRTHLHLCRLDAPGRNHGVLLGTHRWDLRSP